jgi:hypothetical protein
LIIGWNDPVRRKQILRDFLALNGEIQRRVDRVPNLEFGIDIPFWLQGTDKETGKPIGLVRYNGVEKAASYHCIDMLDNVGVMNYRDSADGADGIIAHGQDLVRYGEKAGSAKIFMGIETFSYEETRVWFVLGLPHEQFKKTLRKEGKGLSGLSRIDGYRIQVLDDGANYHVGIELPQGEDDPSAETLAVLREISKRFSFVSYSGAENRILDIRARARQTLEKSPKWSGVEICDIPVGNGEGIPGIQAVGAMLDKVTFAQESVDYIHRQLEIAEDYFREYDCFAGMAIHYYKTFLEKCREDSNF